MEDPTKQENKAENLTSAQEKIKPIVEVVEETPETLKQDLAVVNQEVQKQHEIVSDTTTKVNALRHEMGAVGDEISIPSLDGNKKKISQLEARKIELEAKLAELLKSDVSEKYKTVIDEAKQSKIDWAHSEELSRRLKLKGATEEDVEQIKNWLVNNTMDAKTFILPPEKYKEVIGVLQEMTGETNIQDGKAFHVPGGRTDIPEDIKSSIFLKENLAKPAAPGDREIPVPTIDTNDLHHELGHVAQDGLLESELYQDWKPSFKEGAPDKEYIGLLNETDTRIRAMFRELSAVFDPHKDIFSQIQIDALRSKIQRKELNNKDVKDLLEHYDDATIIELANKLPAI